MAIIFSMTQAALEQWAALYVRLSRDDDNEGDSNSIAHQIEILARYAKDHGINKYKIYKDDSDKIGLNQQSPYSKGGALI